MKPKGTLYIIAAASGTGKSSLAQALAQKLPDVKISISHTTRPIRAGELANEHYFFVTKREFEELMKQGEFLEYAFVFGNHYGTSKSLIDQYLSSGIDVILDIDWQGARQIREKTECITIFLLPPSKKELRNRLEKRNRESRQIINERMQAATAEISHYKEFDYLVINDNFDDALCSLETIIRAQRLLLKNQRPKLRMLLDELTTD